MRFCMITTFYPPYNFGGDGIFVQRLSHELARRGHSVEVVHCIDSYRLLGGKSPAAAEDHPRVTRHGLRNRWGPLAPLVTHQTGRPLLNASRLRKILARGFDVINYHNISLVGGPGILAYGDAVKLYTLHEYWLVCPMHVLFKNKREPCRQRQCLRCTLTYRRPPQLWRYGGMLRKALGHVDCFIAATHFVQEQHERTGHAQRCVVLPHFAPRAEGALGGAAGGGDPGGDPRADANGGYFLFVGRLEKAKGLQTLLPIFLRRPDLRLVVVGSGSYEGTLREMARGSANVRFMGPLPLAELRPLYRHAIALLVPSLWHEVFPLVILEAFSEGTPAVVRRVGSLPEEVGEGVRGETFTTPAEAEAAMDRLQGDRDHRAALSRACLESAQREYSLDTYVDRYLEIISSVRRGKAGPA